MSQLSINAQIQSCLQRWVQGEEVARDELLTLASGWLRRLVAIMRTSRPAISR